MGGASTAGTAAGTLRPERVVEEALDRAAAWPELNALTDVPAGWAMAGMPFAAKNLFNTAGPPTRAGSAIGRGLPAATRSAVPVGRLEQPARA